MNLVRLHSPKAVGTEPGKRSFSTEPDAQGNTSSDPYIWPGQQQEHEALNSAAGCKGVAVAMLRRHR
jgi:hypothetical protein